mgnify:CR=1 FL=1
MTQLVGNRGMPGKIQRKANALDLQITGDIADFMFQRDKILTMRQTQTDSVDRDVTISSISPLPLRLAII